MPSLPHSPHPSFPVLVSEKSTAYPEFPACWASVRATRLRGRHVHSLIPSHFSETPTPPFYYYFLSAVHFSLNPPLSISPSTLSGRPARRVHSDPRGVHGLPHLSSRSLRLQLVSDLHFLFCVPKCVHIIIF